MKNEQCKDDVADRKVAKKVWLVTLQHGATRRTREVSMPGGLAEAEARRGAALKLGSYWRPIQAVLESA